MCSCAQDGRCKTLDTAADGYMRGEACVVHLLEAFTDAELAATGLQGSITLLQGTAVNQDGRSSSLTVCPTCFGIFCTNCGIICMKYLA